MSISIIPAFAEVTEIKTNTNSYLQGDTITIKGTVEPDSKGLVSIVIRDPTDKFVLLTQAQINSDFSFDKKIIINEKFQSFGNYSTTGFILNMTAGNTISFDLLQEFSVIEPIIEAIETVEDEEIPLQELEKLQPLIDEDDISETIGDIPESKIASFVDKNKDPQDYLERYYTEPIYKSWFDKNYPDLTIEEAVGSTFKIDSINDETPIVEQIIEKEIIPEAQATSIVVSQPEPTNNSESAQIVLAISSLVILFGVIYGIKRRVDTNSRQISLNSKNIKKKLFSPILGSKPLDILQMRLAKGEITVEEYDKLKQKII